MRSASAAPRISPSGISRSSARPIWPRTRVRGCMVIKPWGYAIWENMQRAARPAVQGDRPRERLLSALHPDELPEKEAEHVEGFAKECAVVTHHRLEAGPDGKLMPDGELEEPLIVRPTSETIIGEMYREMGGELPRPAAADQPMGQRRALGDAHAAVPAHHRVPLAGGPYGARDEAEAVEETMRMLEVYGAFAESDMAMPVIQGEKTAGERFPGAVDTYTIEAMMQDRKALQAGTSHFLGQNFAKAANIAFHDKDGGVSHAYTTSWGVSTRLIGALIMTHSDDDGLRLPPKLAPQHVVIVPIIRDEASRDEVVQAAEALAKRLRARRFDGEPVRAKIDLRDDSSSNKRWGWIKKGVPFVVELGPRDVAAGTVALVRRDAIGEKRTLPIDEFVGRVSDELGELDGNLHSDALAYRQANMVDGVANFADLVEHFETKGGTGFVAAKYSGDPAVDAKLAELGLTIRCLPYEQSHSEGKCLVTGASASADAIYAKAY